jgi:hypothetical protein
MDIEDARIEDGRLVLRGEGREFSLPDGVYRRPDGESVTIHDHTIVAAFAPIDVDRATRDELRRYVEGLDEQLSTVGDDAQLANIDLQSALQKQQQTIQMMSNISKLLHDTAMAVIRKIG